MVREFRELPRESRPGQSHTSHFNEHVLDVFKLIHLAETLEVTQMDMPSLEDYKEYKCWGEEDNPSIGPYEIVQAYRQTPDFTEIIKNHPEWEREIEKIKRADYQTYPIILVGGKIVDGIHRLAKAWIDGANTINAKVFKELPRGVVMPK